MNKQLSFGEPPQHRLAQIVFPCSRLHLKETVMRVVLALFMAVTVACGGGDKTAAPLPPKQIEIDNYLHANLSVSVDGTAYGGVPANGLVVGTAIITVPGAAKTLAYSVLPFQYSDGSPVLTDLTGESLTIPSGDALLQVNNIIGGQPYISFDLSNTAGAAINVAIVANNQVRCLGSLPSGAYQFYGFYALTSTSEVRYYGAGTNCSGAYRYWTTAQLNAYETNSGHLVLTANLLP